MRDNRLAERQPPRDRIDGYLAIARSTWELYACVGLCVFGRFIASIPRWFVRVIPTEPPLNGGGQDHLK